MVISGKELKTYDDFDKYFHWMKCLTEWEVLDYLSSKLFKQVEAPMTAKEYARQKIEDEVIKHSDFTDSVLIVFTFSAFMNRFMLDNIV